MKNRNILFTSLIALLSISTLASCNGSNNSTSNNSQITSSINEELLAQRAELENMLNKLNNGLTLEGIIKEKFNLLDGYHGNPINQTINVKYDAEYIYEVSEEKAYSAIVTYQEEGYPEEEFLNTQVFEGEDGCAYYEELDYDNIVKRHPYYSIDTDQKINYGYYCLNPFNYLLPEDFTKIGDNTYSLSKGKASFLASNIFGDIDDAFAGVIEKCEFIVEDNQFKSFTLVPTKSHGEFTDLSTQSAVYYYAEFEAKFDFKNIGTSKVKRLQSKEKTDETEALQNAFNKFKNKNYTAYLYGSYVNQDNEFIGENHEYTYYDGEEIYMSFIEDQSAHDEVNNNYCSLGANGKLGILGLTYEEATPKMSEIDASIFNYNPETELYSICDEMVSYIGAVAIVPLITNFYVEIDGYTTACDIKLDSEGNIEYVNIKYELQFALSAEYGDIMITFYDIDNTKIPHGLKTYE